MKGRTKRKKKNNPKRILLIVLLAVIAVGLFIYADTNWIGVTHDDTYSVRIPKAFDGYKIVQLSDLHSKEFGKDNKTLLKRIKAAKPDIIVVTGDMMNSKNDNGEVFQKLAKELTRICPVYYVVGNHEENVEAFDSKEMDDYYSRLKECKVEILSNEKTELVKNGGKIDMYGMWFNLKYYPDRTNSYTKDIKFTEDNMKQIMGKKDGKGFSILLTHDPLYFDTYAAWGADLTLCGHLHGGIVRLPFVGGLLSPEIQFFPKYSGGKYFKGGKEMIVSRGLGNSDIKFRIFNRPEIVEVTLHSTDKK